MSELQELVELALAVRARAHVPYSGFQVGAALRDSDGHLHAGCNVENAAYPLGMCAEAGALSAMIAAGGKRCTEIVIIARGPDIVTPCGGCRQRLRELAETSTRIHCCDETGQVLLTTTLGELLPYAFSDGNLREGRLT